MSSERSARAQPIVPSHGVGLLTPYPKGVSGNPGGVPLRLREVQSLCRNKSMAAARALIALVEDVDANGLPRQDGRIVVVAAQTILTWAYGKPPEYDPKEDRASLAIDTSSLSTEERKFLLALLRRGIVKEAEPDTAAPEPPVIDAAP